MEKTIIILTIGIPGAGKTTWIRSQVKRQPGWVVSTDDLRTELFGDIYHVSAEENEAVHHAAQKRVKNILCRPGKEATTIIYVDATNCNMREWIRFKALHPTMFVAKFFNVSPDMAMIRQTMRDRHVAKEVLEHKWEELKRDKKMMPLIFDLII